MRTLKFLFLIIGISAIFGLSGCGNNSSAGNVAVEDNTSVSEVNQSDSQLVNWNSLKVFTTDGEELKLVFLFEDFRYVNSTSYFEKQVGLKKQEKVYASDDRDDYVERVLASYQSVGIVFYNNGRELNSYTVFHGDDIELPVVAGENFDFEITFYSSRGDSLLKARAYNFRDGEIYSYIDLYGFNTPLYLDMKALDDDIKTITLSNSDGFVEYVEDVYDFDNDIIKVYPKYTYSPDDLVVSVSSYEGQLFFARVSYKSLLGFLSYDAMSLGKTQELDLEYDKEYNDEHRLLYNDGELVAPGEVYSSSFVSSGDRILVFGSRSLIENNSEEDLCYIFENSFYYLDIPEVNLTINGVSQILSSSDIYPLKKGDEVKIFFENTSNVDAIFNLFYPYGYCVSEEVEGNNLGELLGELLEEAPSENP